MAWQRKRLLNLKSRPPWPTYSQKRDGMYAIHTTFSLSFMAVSGLRLYVGGERYCSRENEIETFL